MPLFLAPVFNSSGHLVSPQTSGTPTFTSVNANIANLSILAGDDVRGIIQFDVQTASIAVGSNLFTLNFAKSYGSGYGAFFLSLLNANIAVANLWYEFTQSAGTAIIYLGGNSNLSVATAYKIHYLVMG